MFNLCRLILFSSLTSLIAGFPDDPRIPLLKNIICPLGLPHTKNLGIVCDSEAEDAEASMGNPSQTSGQEEPTTIPVESNQEQGPSEDRSKRNVPNVFDWERLKRQNGYRNPNSIEGQEEEIPEQTFSLDHGNEYPWGHSKRSGSSEFDWARLKRQNNFDLDQAKEAILGELGLERHDQTTDSLPSFEMMKLKRNGEFGWGRMKKSTKPKSYEWDRLKREAKYYW